MKAIRLCVAAPLVLSAMAIPVAVIFGEPKLTDDQKKAAITACIDKFTQCASLCASYSIPQMQTNCYQDCQLKYNMCLNAIARRTPKGQSGLTSSVAPPRPTPRKTSPRGVAAVSTQRGPATSSPASSTSTQQPLLGTDLSRQRSPAPQPKLKKKSPGDRSNQ
jgi:hypothetical protein